MNDNTKNEQKFLPGDRVDYTNEQGVAFPGKRVVEIDSAQDWDREPRYFIAPTDTPWFSVAEKNLAKAADAPISAEEFFGEPISVYTRAQGIEDGVLVDVSERARQYGLLWPVAMTAGAWSDCVAWTEETNKRKGTGQDESGRLSDVCAMAAMRMRVAAAKGQESSNVRLLFRVLRTPEEGRGAKPRPVDLVLHVGPGDAGEPVLTIMLTNED